MEDTELSRMVEEQARFEQFKKCYYKPPTWEEAQTFEQQEDLAVASILEDKDLSQYRNLEDPPGSIRFPDFDSLENFLADLFEDVDIAKELVDHERKHAAQAEKHGFKYHILLKVHLGENGKKSIQPAIVLDIPDNMEPIQAKKALREILEAPDDLSESDLKRLNKI